MANGFGSMFIGVAGLQSSQNALNVTSNNLANLDTTGYVRQSVLFADRDYVTFNTTAAISNSYTSCGTTTSTGLVTCNLVGVAAGTANITLTTNSAATVTTGVSVVAGSVRVSDGVATKVDYAFDKATYAR